MTRPAVAFSRDADLTGPWSGEYWYRGVSFPTPFTAHFLDTAGSLSGTTLEPNTFASPDVAELSADISGRREALSVSFTKTYHRAPGVHSLPIFYSGVVDENLTLIDGEWNFGAAGQFSGQLQGRFVLTRVSGRRAAAVRRKEAVGARR